MKFGGGGEGGRYPPLTSHLLILFKVSAKESLEDLLSFQDEVLVKLRLTEQSEVGGMKHIELGFDQDEVECGLLIWERL